jgi:hypothetical protein
MMALPWTLGPISDSLHSVRPATDFKTESLLLKHSFFRQKNTAKYLFADSIDFSRYSPLPAKTVGNGVLSTPGL